MELEDPACDVSVSDWGTGNCEDDDVEADDAEGATSGGTNVDCTCGGGVCEPDEEIGIR